MVKYDRAITVFSPDGHLFQVEYALEAVKKGTTAVGVRGEDIIVLAVEKKAIAKLQDPRTVQKICQVDDHICLTFAGLSADARVLIDKARFECQNYALQRNEPVRVDYLAKHVAGVQQRFTQRGGVRPFGLATLISGFDANKKPQLWATDPSGNFVEWKANAIGRNSKDVREYLEKNYPTADGTKPNSKFSSKQYIELAVKALLEVVESGAKTLEIVTMKHGESPKHFSEEEIEAVLKVIETERDEAEKEKKDRQARIRAQLQE
eukprot:TRINITY_DN35700_c0_g1_i1.p1 TRINITY_DN35700_c0_g1~~TRINITY_DN35700_c0_g1_i1.p1  ORF type:complete len:264 (+),score=64.69 TRINITY_DN35700_c0_g1_i1:96-887(+)